MKRIRMISGFILLATVAGYSYADAIITYSDDPDVLVGAHSAYVQNGRVLIKEANNERTDIIFEAASGTMYVVDHNNRTVMHLTEQVIDNLVGQVGGMASIIQQQLAEQMANMSADERAQMEALMGGLGLGDMQAKAEPAAPTLQATGNAEYGGIACTINDVIQAGETIAKVCFSKGNNIGVTEADFLALIGMQNFTFKMASKAEQFSGMLGGNIPSFGEMETNNLIIQGTKLTSESNSINIIGVSDESLPAGTTALPEGYTEEQLPSLSDLM
ncbi:MAG: hypothetical protein HOM55_07305 [Proteobacteria bacterium]|jgi:hypothetical protein|nr:hypothetical protein [Pseudomonadota bacterium]